MGTVYTAVMDQAKIGSFIAELRREKNLTQAQLGELLGVTNKTVSRWECGNYMPDLAVIPLLAAELGITVNELIAGQRFAEEDYKRDADRQLLQTLRLVDEVRQAKEQRQVAQVVCWFGFVLLLSLGSYYMFKPGMERLSYNMSYSLALAFLGALGLLLKRDSWLKRNALILLRASADMLIISVFWYALAHNYFVLLPGAVLGLLCVWLGSLGDNLYYKTIDTLLQKTEDSKVKS